MFPRSLSLTRLFYQHILISLLISSSLITYPVPLCWQLPNWPNLGLAKTFLIRLSNRILYFSTWMSQRNLKLYTSEIELIFNFVKTLLFSFCFSLSMSNTSFCPKMESCFRKWWISNTGVCCGWWSLISISWLETQTQLYKTLVWNTMRDIGYICSGCQISEWVELMLDSDGIVSLLKGHWAFGQGRL